VGTNKEQGRPLANQRRQDLENVEIPGK